MKKWRARVWCGILLLCLAWLALSTMGAGERLVYLEQILFFQDEFGSRSAVGLKKPVELLGLDHILLRVAIAAGFLALLTVILSLQNKLRLANEEEIIDSLTGLSRGDQGGKKFLVDSFNQHVRQGLDWTVLFLDLDDFGEFNKLFGHHGGDAVLARTAKILCEGCREDDLVVRWGGEEIVLLISGVSGQDARLSAERIRAGIASETYQLSRLGGEAEGERGSSEASESEAGLSKERSVTVSIGLHDSEMGLTEWDAVQVSANAAMQQAKANGKNQVMEASR